MTCVRIPAGGLVGEDEASQQGHVRVKEKTKALEVIYVGVNRVRRHSVAAVVSPMLPNTGPGVARPFVSQIAIPSPYK